MCACMSVTEYVVCVVPDVWTEERVNRRFLTLVNISESYYRQAMIFIS